MAALEKKEIIDELKKLGIDTVSESNACLEEYNEYYASFYRITESKYKLVLKDMVRRVVCICKKREI